MAHRFANGDWREIGIMMPIIDKLVEKAGWIPFVAANYLSLCEQASKDYPAQRFADQVLSILGMVSCRDQVGMIGHFRPALPGWCRHWQIANTRWVQNLRASSSGFSISWSTWAIGEALHCKPAIASETSNLGRKNQYDLSTAVVPKVNKDQMIRWSKTNIFFVWLTESFRNIFPSRLTHLSN